MTRRRVAFALLALTFGTVAMTMPTAWYYALPRDTALPAPAVSGALLLRIFLAVQAVACSVLAWRDIGFMSMRATSLPAIGGNWCEAHDITQSSARYWLAAITSGALLLRLYGVSSDMWIDELAVYYDYGPLSMLEVFGTYISSNNHLLNTLLLKLMVNAFGAHEWSMRLTAILFGVATIPALYWCARLVLSRRAALGSAVLLAVSYHHIFFSQNARGYSAYLFFALVATRALVDALREDGLHSWLLFAFATVLGFAALLNAAFVLAVHVVVVLIAIVLVHRRGDSTRPLASRALTVFGATSFVSVELYAVALPVVYVVMTHVYKQKNTGFAPTSGEFAHVLIQGLTAGFGTGTAFAVVAAFVFLGIAAAGFFALLRRSWVLAVSLAAPGVLTALFLLARGLTFSPRFFLLWLPLTAITAALAVDIMCTRLFSGATRERVRTRSFAAIAVVVSLSALSLLSLKQYYAIPKQPYRAAVRYVEAQRAADDMVVVMHLAKYGIRYYATEQGAPLATRYRFANTLKQLDTAIARTPHARVWLITTLERSLRMEYPKSAERVYAKYERRIAFPATIGDGDVSVWTER